MDELVLFIHVVGALGVAAAYTVDAVGLIGLRRATLGEQARTWLITRRWVLVLGPTSIGIVLVSGLYLTVVSWGPDAWILVSLGTLLAIAVIGGVLTGIPMARVGPGIERASGPLPEDVRRALRSPALSISISMRISTTVGIVFLMVEKPDLLESLIAISIAACIGVAAGLAIRFRDVSMAVS
jgi:hypothetical protein